MYIIVISCAPRSCTPMAMVADRWSISSSSTAIKTITKPLNPRGICVIRSRLNSSRITAKIWPNFGRGAGDRNRARFWPQSDCNLATVQPDTESAQTGASFRSNSNRKLSKFYLPEPPTTVLASEITVGAGDTELYIYMITCAPYPMWLMRDA